MAIICYGDKMKTICIIGAGPSGLFCAHKILSEYCSTASKEDFRIVIIEKGEKPLQDHAQALLMGFAEM